MAAPFVGLFTGSSTAAPAAPSSSKGAFSGLFTAKSAPTPAAVAPIAPGAPASAPTAPITAPAPVSTPSGIPASALKGSLGGGYGTSNIKDAYSGKPLLTYENQTAKASQLLSDRVAPTFDPTVPQKVDPSVLHNGRMPEAASEAVRKATGAEPDEQLDHLISLELGGSNDTSNLNLEKLKSDGTQPSLDLENQTAKQVASGQISYVDGQKIIARAKGVQLPDDQDFASSKHPLAGGYPNPAPNQTGTQAQTNKPSLFSGLLTGKTTSGQPTLLAKAGNYVKNAFTNPGATSLPLFKELGGDAIVHPIQTLNSIVDNAKQGIDTTLQNLASTAKTVVGPNQSASQRTASVLNFLTSAASTLFTPVSEIFNIASQLPIIKPAADATGLIFNKTGQVGGFAADKLLAALPISQGAKDNLATAVHNVGTLAGQIILGGHIYGAITGLADAKGELLPEQEKIIVADANDKAQQLNKASMPNSPKAPAPEKAAPAESTAQTPAPEKTPEVAPIEGTGQTKTSSLAQGVEAKAIEDKLTRGFSDLPQYKTVSMKDQAAKAVDLITNNYDQAKRIAMGQEKAPEGVLPESVFVAVEDKALKEGDVNTLRDLATQSSLTSEATTMGQRIRTLAERDEASPTEAITRVQSAREKAAQAKLGKGDTLEKAKGRISEDIKGEIRKAAPKKEDWSSFVKSIQC
jgi:hypothetical protein